MAELKKIQREQLKIYYYFMLCDGQLSSEESERLNIICREMDIPAEEKDKLIQSVESRQHYVEADGSINGERVLNALKNLLNNSDTEINYSWNKSLRLETIWNLTSLAYADEAFSPNEMEYLSVLRKKWKIAEEIIAAFADTAETIRLLENSKAAVRQKKLSYSELERYTNEADNKIARLMGYVKTEIEAAQSSGGMFGLFAV